MPVVIDGSSTLHPAFEALKKNYARDNPQARVDLFESSSGHAIDRLIAGEIDIALVSRDLQDADLDKAAAQAVTLRSYLVAFDAIVFIVHPSRAGQLSHLTAEQVRDLFFSGTATDWSSLNPSLRGPLHVHVHSPTTSGVAATLGAAVNGKLVSVPPHFRTHPRTAEVARAVAEDPDGIGYTSRAFLIPEVATVGYGESRGEAVACSTETIRDGSYPLRYRLHAVVLEPSPFHIMSFMDFVMSADGQRIVGSHGLDPFR